MEEVEGCFGGRPEKGRLDRGLAKDRDRRRAQIMGKTSELCEHRKKGRQMRRERGRQCLNCPGKTGGVSPPFRRLLHDRGGSTPPAIQALRETERDARYALIGACAVHGHYVPCPCSHRSDVSPEFELSICLCPSLDLYLDGLF